MQPSWPQRVCSDLWTSCVVAFLQDTLTPCSKGGVTLVTVYLEPGLKASGLHLWLLEALAAFCLGFDGPWIAMGDWNMEPTELARSG